MFSPVVACYGAGYRVGEAEDDWNVEGVIVKPMIRILVYTAVRCPLHLTIRSLSRMCNESCMARI